MWAKRAHSRDIRDSGDMKSETYTALSTKIIDTFVCPFLATYHAVEKFRIALFTIEVARIFRLPLLRRFWVGR